MAQGNGRANTSRMDRRRAGQRITQGLIRHVGSIVETCGADAILVYVDAVHGDALPLSEDLAQRVIYVTKTVAEEQDQAARGRVALPVPGVPLTRLGQVKIAIFMALARGLVRRGDVVVCLSGIAGSGTLDTLIVTEVGREFEIVAPSSDDEGSEGLGDIQPEVLEHAMNLASVLASEGREGKPVGSLLVIGDTGRVLSLSRQLILNPFRGYSEADRNILDPRLEETVKELSQLDGAFVVRGDGVIESCGVYLNTTGEADRLPPGLGTRHHAAAGITAVTNAVAVTVSESTGSVCIFRGGQLITAIEQPQTTGRSVP